MPAPGADEKLQTSILDRLIDLEPRTRSESADRAARHLVDIKKALRRDLEWLLNTKRPPIPALARPGPLADSVLGYGIPDLSALSLANLHDRERLRRMLQEAVARFEPRLTGVSVTLVEGRRDERSLHFRIDGLLDIEPHPEVVSFDSAIQLHTRAIEVKGGGVGGAGDE